MKSGSSAPLVSTWVCSVEVGDESFWRQAFKIGERSLLSAQADSSPLSRWGARSLARALVVGSQDGTFGLVRLWEGNPPETGVLSVALYSRRLTRELYSCCIGTVIHAVV